MRTGWLKAGGSGAAPRARLHVEGSVDHRGKAGVHVGGLQTWATCVTSALTHRVRLSAEDVTGPFRDLLPGLERRMNELLWTLVVGSVCR